MLSQMRTRRFQETKKKRKRLKSDVHQKARRSWRENSTKQYTFRTEIGVGTVCVGLERQHHTDGKSAESEEEKANKVPRMVLNYHFMSTRDAGDVKGVVLAMKDESTGNRYLRPVGQKGVEGMEWLVKDICEELKSWGHMGGAGGRIIIETDGESSIVTLRDAIARYRGGVATPEVPPTGESQAHGSAEDNGRRMRSLVKVYKDQLETRASVKLQATDVILLWLVRWAAMAYSRYKIGEDGKTPYERQKGRKCNLEVVPFGELVRYKKLGETSQERKSLESSWSEGVWLGHARGSSESFVGAKDGVVRAWTIRRLPEGERWGPESSPRCKAPLQGQAR